MRCITGTRFNMLATVLNNVTIQNSADLEASVTGGTWETYQDEESGAIRKRWVPNVVTPVRPGQSHIVDADRFDIECEVRGFPEVGFRSSANTETFFDGVYSRFEAVHMKFPAKYVLNRNMLVTNIRGRNKQLLWIEEETGNPTVFEVQGVTPTFDPFGRHIDNLTVLKRAAVQ